jgi:hypothetical protein
MRHTVPRLTVLLALAFTVGCLSENRGKLEGTRWSSLAATFETPRGKIRRPNGYVELHFHTDGSLYFIIQGKLRTGKYTLGMGNAVTLYLDEPVAGMKTHTETVTINGDRLTMTDTDGTSLTFRRQN